jgi:hypothetical protein
MKHKVPMAIGIALVIIVSTSPFAFASAKAGANCTKLNSTTIISGYKYKCIKFGKKKIWTQSSKVMAPVVTRIFPSNDEIRTGMQSILDNFDYSSVDLEISPNYFIEPGKNGIYEKIIKDDFKEAAKALFFISGKNPYPKVNVLIGRSQSWLQKEVAVNCTGSAFTGDVVAAFSMSPCSGFRDTGLIAINLPGVVTNRYLNADPFIDLSDYQVNANISQKVRNLAPHEFYHLWQSSLWPWPTEVPSWFMEGTAQVFSLLVRAKLDKRPNSYSTVFNEWFSKEEIAFNQTSCQNSIAEVDYSMTTQCQYLQGILPVEVLLVRYGGINSWRKLNELVATMPFDQALSEITKKPINDFYAEVDIYARKLGWLSN